jgi:hypothetical protein
MSIDEAGESVRTRGALVPVATAISLRQALPRANTVTSIAPEAEPNARPSGTWRLATPTTLLVAQLLGTAYHPDACVHAGRAAHRYRVARHLACMPAAAAQVHA